MPSPWQSGLAKLDESLQPLQSQLDRLQAGLEVSDAELFHSLEEAQQSAAAVRDLILAERPDLSWSDRGSLEQVVQQLEAAARERVNQQRRSKLLELASELEAGTVKHRVEARTTALNSLRLEAVAELRSAAEATEQENELPGPEACEWLLWAAGLEEEKDAATVSYLRRDYPTLERFAGELDERYWKPVIRPDAQKKGSAEPTPKAATQTDAKPSESAAASDTTVKQPAAVPPGPVPTAAPAENTNVHNYRVDKTAEGATTAPVMGEAPVNSTVNMFKVPSRQRSGKSVEEPKVEPVVVESIAAEPPEAEPEVVEASSDSAEEKMPSFGVLSQAKRPAAIWIAAAAGVILLSAVFAGIYRSSAKASNSPGGAAIAKTDVPNPAPSAPAQPVVKQAVEGAQRQTALDLERCQRVNPGNVECWGYVSNVGTDPARISLQSVDVVDGKGNTFNLRGVGQLDFTTGRSSNVAGGARAKYTVTVPDKDPNAKTLTLYVDVTNPHALEFTFRDVPIT